MKADDRGRADCRRVAVAAMERDEQKLPCSTLTPTLTEVDCAGSDGRQRWRQMRRPWSCFGSGGAGGAAAADIDTDTDRRGEKVAEQAAVAVKADGVAGESSRLVVAAMEEEQRLSCSTPTLTLTETNTETLAVTADRGGGRSDGRRVAVAVTVQQHSKNTIRK